MQVADSPTRVAPTTPSNVDALAGQLFDEHWQTVCRRTDRLFAGLMLFQWIAGIFAACVISPRTWIGDQSQVHPHVWAAVLLGGVIMLLPVVLVLLKPGHTLTRCTIAAAQMLSSALLIHLTG